MSLEEYFQMIRNLSNLAKIESKRTIEQTNSIYSELELPKEQECFKSESTQANTDLSFNLVQSESRLQKFTEAFNATKMNYIENEHNLENIQGNINTLQEVLSNFRSTVQDIENMKSTIAQKEAHISNQKLQLRALKYLTKTDFDSNSPKVCGFTINEKKMMCKTFDFETTEKLWKHLEETAEEDWSDILNM